MRHPHTAVDKTAEMVTQAGESYDKAVQSGKQVAQEASEASKQAVHDAAEPFFMV